MTSSDTPAAPGARQRGGLAEDLSRLAGPMRHCEARTARWHRGRVAVRALRAFAASRLVWALTLGGRAMGALNRAG